MTPSEEPPLIALANRKPLRISTTTWLTAPLASTRDAPSDRLRSPDTIAAILSAEARSRFDDAAIKRPSDDTAIDCSTPAVFSTNDDNNQLTLRACVLIVEFIRRLLRRWGHPGGPSRRLSRSWTARSGPVRRAGAGWFRSGRRVPW